MAVELREDVRVASSRVRASNQESIHDHSAVAQVRWERAVSEPRTILVITSCTGLKALPAWMADSGRGSVRRRAAPQADARGFGFPSCLSRSELDLRILSAGHGLVSGTRPLRRLRRLFPGFERPIWRCGPDLGVPRTIRRVLSATHALGRPSRSATTTCRRRVRSCTQLASPVIAFRVTGCPRLAGSPR